MKVLNLDPLFKPYADYEEIVFEAFTFKGGEPHIKINSTINEEDRVIITSRIRSFNEFGLLCIVVDALKRMFVNHIELYIPYFPGARQDRLMINGEPLTVKVYADIINAMNFKKVYVFDAHSEVTTALVNNCIPLNNHNYIKDVITDINEECLLISPDGGALKKIYKVAAFLGNIDVIECSKSRDVKTGNLSEIKVYGDDLKGKSCLIVDDICDGGGTFLGLAEELKKKNAGKIFLAISHGIFSKGTEVFHGVFEKVYCTNSFRDVEDPLVKVLNLKA